MIVAWDRSRYDARRLRLPRAEAEVQAGVLAVLAARGVLALADDADGTDDD